MQTTAEPASDAGLRLRLARVQVALGVLWIVDALLQLQPANLGAGLGSVIVDNAMGQPGWAQQLLARAAQLAGPHASLLSPVVAAVQLAIGVAIVHPRSRRAGLLASLPWALLVWVVGEGSGNLATGFAMLPTGAPGAALVDAVLALVLLPRRTPRAGAGRSPAGLTALGEPGARCAWVALWSAGALLQLEPVGTLGFKLFANFQMLSLGEPGPVASADRAIGDFVLGHGDAVTAVAVAIELGAAAAAVVPFGRLRSPVLAASLVLCGLLWAVGENLGGLLSGSASDVGAMPLYVLLAVALLPLAGPSPRPARAGRRAAAPPAAARAGATGLTRVPTSSMSICTTSPRARLNGRSGTSEVPVESTTPSGNSISRTSQDTRSSSRRCSWDVEPAAS